MLTPPPPHHTPERRGGECQAFIRAKTQTQAMGKHKYCVATMALCGDRKTGMLPHTYGLAQMHGRQVSAWGSVTKNQGVSNTETPERAEACYNILL